MYFSPVRSADAQSHARPFGLSWPAQLAAVGALALCAHAIYWSTRPPDMRLFLEPWFAHLVRYGPIGAFAHPFSNYEPAYLYLLAFGSLAHNVLSPMDIIKLLSVAGSVFLTFAVANLLKTLGTPARLAVFTLVLPTVVINAALLGQCDALWAGSCVFALAALMRGETIRSLVWCGVAIAFKSQAAFIAPVIIGGLIGRRAPLWQWTIPALVFLASLVPAWLLGWPLWQLLTAYPGQAALVEFPGRLGNPWMFGTMFANHAAREFFLAGYVTAGMTAVAIGVMAARLARSSTAMLTLALLSATALPFLLPKMLERYYFLGDVLALALALSLGTRRAGFIALAVQLASLVSLLTYIYWFYWPYPTLLGAGFAAAALGAICLQLSPSIAAQRPASDARTAA